jgi:hypothetical protein
MRRPGSISYLPAVTWNGESAPTVQEAYRNCTTELVAAGFEKIAKAVAGDSVGNHPVPVIPAKAGIQCA